MSRRARPAPTYKARLAQRRERLQQRQQLQAAAEAHACFLNWQMEFLRARAAALDAKTPLLPSITRNRVTSFFERLFIAAADTTDRLAQDFTPKKGAGDARFFA